ncbi:hypothetical protein A3862_15445 [Methylobacterium sp. XJLW]|uniref:hypothetical protein n=1 Tax=Methylobacterium sp. XJLW TaxID=739141 RepID=UPI000DAB05A6|nr:hypothetical protein [Methylobacterium sp. XJLW]AWV16720.1 hypothetical protein A3862_15445 [Methylobacterium sp. XJLW]
MSAVVIVECGRETRTAFVSERDANGDERTEAAASIIAGFRVHGYILATGPMPDGDVAPALWPFPLSDTLDIHTQIAGFQRRMGSGTASPRAAVFKAIRGTVRTVTSSEIDAYLGRPPATPAKPARRRALPPARPNVPVQLALF